jgi:heme oxygenase (biliverdin-IX-beta and delta-forming)
MNEGARALLRAATREEHERLDALMGRFDLKEREGYRDFLTAHALALPAVEAALDAEGFANELADWPGRRRTDAIAADLAVLDGAMPAPLAAPALATPAARWGAAYVLEGSRLGGVYLAKQIADDLPRSYLGSPQPPGHWRSFIERLDRAIALPGETEEAQNAARAVFALFERAGRQMERS